MNRVVTRSRPLWLAAALVFLSSSFYIGRLAWSSPYLSIEEITQARHALSIARTGRSLSGQRLPLYPAEPGYPAGWEPLGIYATVALLKIAPFSEALVRLPSALGGVVNIVLMFFLARRVFRSDWFGAAAALMLAFTPAHFIQSRIGTSQILVATFTLSWLVCLARYQDTRRHRDLFFAAMSLGFGVYAYPGALVVMPLCFLATVSILFFQEGQSARGSIGVACAGMTLALVPWIAWHTVHAERFSQLTDYYTHNGYNQDLGLNSFLACKGINAHLDAWWNSFNPERMFFTGDSSLRFSTRRAGYLLWPTAPFIVLGVWRASVCVAPVWRWLIVAGILAGPLPAALVSLDEFKRWLSILPFITLAAVCGLHVMLRTRRTWANLIAIALVAGTAYQFAEFLHDYWNDYRSRVSYFLGGNLPAALREAVVAAQDPRCVFVDSRIGAVPPYWEVYGPPGAPPPKVVDAEASDFALTPSCRSAGVIVLEKETGQPALRRLVETRGWSVARIPEPDGRVALDVFRLAPD